MVLLVSGPESGSTLQENFTTLNPGDYYYVLSSSPQIDGKTYTLQYAGTFNVSSVTSFSNDLSLDVIGPPSVVQDTNATYRILETYSNNSLLSGPDTNSTIHNLTFAIYSGNSLYESLTAHYLSEGTLYSDINVSTPGNYFLIASVSPTFLGTKQASAQFEANLNITNAPVNVSQNMQLTLSAPQGVVSNAPFSYTASVAYQDGKPMDLSDTNLVAADMNITVKNFSMAIEYGSPHVLTAGVIVFNLSLPTGISFILVSIPGVNLSTGNASAAQSLSMNVASESSIGMSISITIQSQVQTGIGTQATVTISETGGGFLSYTDTLAIASSLGVNIYLIQSDNHAKYMGSPTPTVTGEGQISYTVNESTVGDYSMYVSFNGTISGHSAAAHASQKFSVVAFNPNQNQVWSFLSNPYVITVIGIVLGLIVTYAVAKVGYWLRGRKTKNAQQIANAAKGNLLAEDMKKKGQSANISKSEMKYVQKDLRKGD